MSQLVTRSARSARSAAVAILLAAASGCSSADGGSGYQPGELGNGGFYFSCDDAVSCTKYSDDASKFPKAVSLGSSFAVRFVPKPSSSSSGVDIRFNESAPDRGIVIEPVSDFVTRGPRGFTAVKAGYATLASRDAGGQLVDYVVVRVQTPDALVVYAADDTSVSAPAPVSTVALRMADTKSFKAFARRGTEDLAGSLQVEWKSSNTSVLEVQSTSAGKVTVVARSSGSATLTATGGTFSQDIPVKVSP